MREVLHKSNVSHRLFGCTASVVPLNSYCFGRTRVDQQMWSTRKAMMARLMAVGVSLAILLPLTVSLKPIPMTGNQWLQREQMEETLQIESLKSGEGESDLIGDRSKNVTQEHDVNKTSQKTVNSYNLDISDTIAQNGVLLRPQFKGDIKPRIESKRSDHKSESKSLGAPLPVPTLSIAQNMKQTNVYFGSIFPTNNNNNNANETNAVPTAHRLELAPGQKSISASRESNGHRVRKVISGIGIEAIGRTIQAFLSRSPAVSVKHHMKSQKSERPELFPPFTPFTAGTPIKMFEARDSLNSSLDIISKGIYWSKQLERLTPQGFDRMDDIRWSHLINSSNIIKMVNGCGRMQNRLITLEDGRMSCARHRQNSDQIQGDIFSFYLARVLGISNLPPATLVAVKETKEKFSEKWKTVSNDLISSKWEKPVVLTQFVNNLVPAFIPKLLRGPNRRLHPLAEDIGSLNLSELTELVQWSDLIVFDYLTANLDRIVNNMINEKWNPEMMRNPAHNLLKVNDTGLLLFIDNESGLFHGYRLLNKYERQHRSLLNALCIFREQTVKLIEDLYKNQNFIQLIRTLFRENVLNDTAFKSVPFLPESNIKILYERLNRVFNQINYCKSKYKNNLSIKL